MAMHDSVAMALPRYIVPVTLHYNDMLTHGVIDQDPSGGSQRQAECDGHEDHHGVPGDETSWYG